jgi:hypothetical protein
MIVSFIAGQGRRKADREHPGGANLVGTILVPQRCRSFYPFDDFLLGNNRSLAGVGH